MRSLPDRPALRPPRRQVRAYAVAVGSTALAYALTDVLVRGGSPADGHTVTPFFFAAVAVTAWYGGIGPSLLTAILSVLLIDYFYIAPLFSVSLSADSAVRSVTFLAAAVLISMLSESQRAARARATANAETAEAARREAEAQAVALEEKARALAEQTDTARALASENERLLQEAQIELAEREWAEERLWFQAHLLDSVEQAVIATDVAGCVTYWNRFARRLYGWSEAEALGCPLIDLTVPEEARAVFKDILDRLNRGEPWDGEATLRRKDGSTFPAWLTSAPLLDAGGAVAGVVSVSSDLTERKRLEVQLAHQAFHDPLTGIANRALFLDRVAHALDRARREGLTVAVVFLDLDDFKATNDTLGHATGDDLLVAAADRLRHTVRTGDTAARLGGDEFAVLVEDVQSAASIAELAQRLTTAFHVPFAVAGRELRATASIGYALASSGEAAGDVLRHADVAMYAAKADGRGLWKAYEPSMYRAVVARVALETGLRRALDPVALADDARRELHLVYQPIIDLPRGCTVALEALARWRDPQRGDVSPEHFIAVAEETGMIVPLGRWVLEEACREAARWRREAPDVSVTVNVSARQLADASFVDDVRAAMAGAGLEANGLILEITESVLIDHTVEVPERLAALKALGVRLAIDDFGTGYSSLGYLQHVPADLLKIDRAFVHALGGHSRDAVIAGAVVALGTALGMSIIAEGVETAEQARHLRRMGCGQAQGFYYARPLPPADVAAALVGCR